MPEVLLNSVVHLLLSGSHKLRQGVGKRMAESGEELVLTGAITRKPRCCYGPEPRMASPPACIETTVEIR
jgi:hypothetical protein